MKIYGLDFTSAPCRRKPITCAGGVILDDRLRLEDLNTFTHFTEFDGFLNRPGPWVAGFDFPFGQPRKLIQNLGWPLSWEGYVRAVARLGKSGFEKPWLPIARPDPLATSTTSAPPMSLPTPAAR